MSERDKYRDWLRMGAAQALPRRGCWSAWPPFRVAELCFRLESTSVRLNPERTVESGHSFFRKFGKWALVLVVSEISVSGQVVAYTQARL